MSRICIQASWEDVPHLTEKAKRELLASTPPHQRDARSKGLPVLGAGVVFPLEESLWTCPPFKLPSHWPRAYGLDADWNRTAAVWGAWDQDSDVVYIYSEYFGGQQPPAVNSAAINDRGNWMTGGMDPSTNGKISPEDGKKLADAYRNLGLALVNADNTVNTGTHQMYRRMSQGGLKIFTSCVHLVSQIRIYRRDKKGQIVKQQDDFVDATRYLIMTGLLYARTEPFGDEEDMNMGLPTGRSAVTGY